MGVKSDIHVIALISLYGMWLTCEFCFVEFKKQFLLESISTCVRERLWKKQYIVALSHKLCVLLQTFYNYNLGSMDTSNCMAPVSMSDTCMRVPDKVWSPKAKYANTEIDLLKCNNLKPKAYENGGIEKWNYLLCKKRFFEVKLIFKPYGFW